MATSITKGTDGVLEITSGGTAAEVPCLRSWTLNSTTSINSENTRCMKSNSDGGSTSAVGWDSNTLQGKSWSVDMEFFWQKTDEGASAYVDVTNAGDTVAIKLYPNDNVTGEKEYYGNGLISTVSVPSQVGSNITQTVTITGDLTLAVATVV